MKPSVLGVRRERSSRLVQEAIKVQGPEAAEKVTERLAQHLLDGEEVPNIWMLMVLFLRWLVTATVEMVKADLAHEEELANDAQHREARDTTTERLVQTLIGMRALCLTLYGKTRLEEIGFTEQTPRDPLTILNVGKKLLELLTNPEFEFPARIYGNLSITPAQIAENVEPLVGALDESFTGVNREIRKAQSSQAVKNQKRDVYDTDFFWITRWFQACLGRNRSRGTLLTCSATRQPALWGRIKASASGAGRIERGARHGIAWGELAEPQVPRPQDRRGRHMARRARSRRYVAPPELRISGPISWGSASSPQAIPCRAPRWNLLAEGLRLRCACPPAIAPRPTAKTSFQVV